MATPTDGHRKVLEELAQGFRDSYGVTTHVHHAPDKSFIHVEGRPGDVRKAHELGLPPYQTIFKPVA
jgi:hypothetical protein